MKACKSLDNLVVISLIFSCCFTGLAMTKYAEKAKLTTIT